MQDKAAKASRAAFQWDDPFLIEEQLTEDERMIRDTARDYCQDKLASRVISAYLEERTDRGIFTAMGALGLLGVTLPDPDLKWNAERKAYDYGAIDWQEFWRVVNGDGPCNKERLATRVKAHEDGAWVREAALAYAAKQAARARRQAA